MMLQSDLEVFDLVEFNGTSDDEHVTLRGRIMAFYPDAHAIIKITLPLGCVPDEIALPLRNMRRVKPG